MGVPIKIKTYELKSKIGDSLKVSIEKVGMGENSDILYRITRGGDRRIADSDKVVLFREELEELIEFLKADFMNREFPE